MKSKKVLCACLVLMFLISLFTGCSAKSEEKALINTNWVSLLYKSSLILNKDGSGIDRGSNMHWLYENDKLQITYDDSDKSVAEFNLIKSDDYYFLQESDNEYMMFVPEEKYESCEEKLKNSMASNAQEISLDEIKISAIQNQAKAEEVYLNKVVKVTGIVTSINSSNIGLGESTEYYQDFDVYMPQSQIAKLKIGDKVTIVGVVKGVSQYFSQIIDEGFVLE